MKADKTKEYAKRWWGMAVALTVGAGLFWLTSIPYEYASQTAKSHNGQWIFSGYLHYPEDMESYKSYIAQSERGRWLFVEPAFKEKQSGAYFNLLWLMAGKIKALFGLTFYQIFFVIRFVAWIFLSIATYLVLKLFIKNQVATVALELLAISTSGIGWLSMLPKKIPDAVADYSMIMQITYNFYFYVGKALKTILFIPERMPISPDVYTETSMFFQAAWVPHVAINTALLMFAAYFSITYANSSSTKNKRLIYAAIIGAIILTIRPYEYIPFILLYALATVFKAFNISNKETKKRVFINSAAWALPSVLLAMYYFWLVYINPIWRVWGASNVYPPPNITMFVQAFFWGLVAFSTTVIWLAVKTIKSKKTSTDNKNSKPIAIITLWVLSMLIFIYSGVFGFAWRLTASLGVLLSVLFALALYLFLFAPMFRNKKRLPVAIVASMVVYSLAFLLISPSNLQSYIGKLEISKRFDKYYFLEKPVAEAMEWAGANIPAGSSVFTHGFYGLKLPSYGDLRPLLWHKDLTPQFRHRKSDYYAFSNSDRAEDRERILGYYKVDVIFWGIVDRNKSPYPNLDNLPFLSKIYENGFVSIYSVMQNRIRYNSLPEYLR